MEASLRSLEFDRVLTLVSLEARTSLGRDALQQRRPMADLDACEISQAELAEMTRFFLHEGMLPLAGGQGMHAAVFSVIWRPLAAGLLFCAS